MSERILGDETSASWEAIYQADDAGWDIGKPAPPFLDLIPRLQPGRMLVPGCGAGHDAKAFADAGFAVSALDFAPTAIRRSREKGLDVIEADFLVAEFAEPFDYVLEHTCFCAISVANRADYVAAAKRALKPGGMLVGLFYRFDPPDDNGPPFAISEGELRNYFEDDFEILELSVPQNSHGRRQGRERLVRMRRK